MHLTKMGPGDDPEAFLVTFEQVATAACWPPEGSATLLAPYLTSQVQTAYRNLVPHEPWDYSRVKAAILDHTSISLETYQEWFCKDQ